MKNSKEAISHKGEDGKVIIIDISIDETSDDHGLNELKLHFDMVILTLHSGKEREKKEWETLIMQALLVAINFFQYAASSLSLKFILIFNLKLVRYSNHLQIQ